MNKVIKHVLLTLIILSEQVNASVPIEKNVIENVDNEQSNVGAVTEGRKNETNFQGVIGIVVGFGFGFVTASTIEPQTIISFFREFLNSSIEDIIVVNGVKAAIVVVIFCRGTNTAAQNTVVWVGRGIGKLTTWLGAGIGLGIGQELIKKFSTGSFNTGIEHTVFLGCEYSDSCYGVKWLIPYLDLKAIRYDGITPLHTACKHGYQEAVKAFISCKADIEAKDSEGNTPLHIATREGHEKIVEHLLSSKGIEVNMQNRNNDTLLHIAIGKGYEGIVGHLLSSKGVEVNIKDRNDNTPLHMAAEGGYLDIVKLLADRAEINEKNKNGDAPLHIATGKGHEKIVEHLLSSNGIEVNIQDRNGDTPLHIAAENGYVNIIRSLTAKGADQKVKNNNGLTALHKAYMNKHLDLARNIVAGIPLMQSEAVNEKDNRGFTVLHMAVDREDIGFVGSCMTAMHMGGWMSLYRYIDINAQDKLGNTPLHIAVEKRNLDLVKVLLDHKAGVNVQNSHTYSPLHIAVQYKSPDPKSLDLVKLLIEHEADVNLADRHGHTPLHMAVATLVFGPWGAPLIIDKGINNDLIIQFLIDKGANVNAKGSSSFTPLSIAIFIKNQHLAQLLINNGAEAEIDEEKRECRPTTLEKLRSKAKKEYEAENLQSMVELKNREDNEEVCFDPMPSF